MVGERGEERHREPHVVLGEDPIAGRRPPAGTGAPANKSVVRSAIPVCPT